MQWLEEAGVAGELAGRQWSAPEISQLPPEERRDMEAAITRLLLVHDKTELYDQAIRRRIAWHMVSTPKDLVDNPQLQARGYYVSVEHPELGESIRYPGAPILYSDGAACSLRRRPPLIGEHNQEVLGEELGLSPASLARLRAGGVI